MIDVATCTHERLIFDIGAAFLRCTACGAEWIADGEHKYVAEERLDLQGNERVAVGDDG